MGKTVVLAQALKVEVIFHTGCNRRVCAAFMAGHGHDVAATVLADVRHLGAKLPKEGSVSLGRSGEAAGIAGDVPGAHQRRVCSKSTVVRSIIAVFVIGLLERSPLKADLLARDLVFRVEMDTNGRLNTSDRVRCVVGR